MARVGRLYKLVKLSRLFRFIKVWKNKNKIIKQLSEFLRVGLGFERLFFFVLIFALSVHLAACFWLITASILGTEIDSETDEAKLTYQGTWLEKYDHEKLFYVKFFQFLSWIICLVNILYSKNRCN